MSVRDTDRIEGRPTRLAANRNSQRLATVPSPVRDNSLRLGKANSRNRAPDKDENVWRRLEDAKEKDEPNTRGTYSLVSSCIFTLGLCVWTAIHLNVPEQAPGARQFFRKLTWLAVGLLAPEVVTFTAWYQYVRASRLIESLARSKKATKSRWLGYRRQLSRILRGHKPQREEDYDMVERLDPDENQGKVGEDWNLVHGFYAFVGGYAFDVSDSAEPFLPGGLTRVILTTDGLYFLRAHAPELIPRMSEEDINDKSKADGLAKTLVAMQVAWFCLQCIARGAQGLPISLLEVTTSGHALYTLLTYILWAKKPMNVSVPTPLAGDRTRMHQLCAYMFMASRISARTRGAERSATSTEFGSIYVDPLESHSAVPTTPPTTVVLRSGDFLAGTGFSPASGFARTSDVGDSAGKLTPNWGCLGRAKPTTIFSGRQDAGRLVVAFTIAEVLYAIIHAMGWNATFGSPREETAWRAATCFVGGGGVFIGVVGFLWVLTNAGKPYWDYWQTWAAVVVVGVLELGIRMFLLIEALLNVKVLPPRVFQLPQWSTYIPHWA
ncbi:hypothetical protein C8R46DRAFT_1027508 [Mycena filopes]|nr:hypothetical protein C8R46DRAFT_1027508 [Mycena filopes]